MRYAWSDVNIHGERRREPAVIEILLAAFRLWDRRAARRVDQFAAVSRFISGRVRAAYQREAAVLYPPVDIERFHPGNPREGYYITVSRLVAHKRVDLIVEAFTLLGLPLTVIGEGPELPRLKRMAGDNVRFRGFTPGEEMAGLLSRARGFVAASEEDFGIAIVEAQASGCPVIAFGCGGALETVIEGSTGTFFHEQTAASLMEAVMQFERLSGRLDPAAGVENAGRFSREKFLEQFARFTGASRQPYALPLPEIPLPLEGFK
jgi:glycosyltransferase involved in cell wall biosynthesis